MAVIISPAIDTCRSIGLIFLADGSHRAASGAYSHASARHLEGLRSNRRSKLFGAEKDGIVTRGFD